MFEGFSRGFLMSCLWSFVFFVVTGFSRVFLVVFKLGCLQGYCGGLIKCSSRFLGVSWGEWRVFRRFSETQEKSNEIPTKVL